MRPTTHLNRCAVFHKPIGVPSDVMTYKSLKLIFFLNVFFTLFYESSFFFFLLPFVIMSSPFPNIFISRLRTFFFHLSQMLMAFLYILYIFFFQPKMFFPSSVRGGCVRCVGGRMDGWQRIGRRREKSTIAPKMVLYYI